MRRNKPNRNKLKIEELTVKELKDELRKLKLPLGGNKEVLVDRLHAAKVTPVKSSSIKHADKARTSLNYEDLVERDYPRFYDKIKDMIPDLPYINLRCITSSRSTNINIPIESKWKLLWGELNNFDLTVAKQKGAARRSFDEDFHNLVIDYDDKLLSEDEKAQLTKVKIFADSDEGLPYVASFFERYPLYSYLLMKLTRMMKLYALYFLKPKNTPKAVSSGRGAECVAVYLTDEEIGELVTSSRIDVMEHLRDYDLIRELDIKFSPFDLRLFPSYIITTAPYNMLKYLVDKGLPITDNRIFLAVNTLNYDKIRLFLDSTDQANLLPSLQRLLQYGRYDILIDILARYRRLLKVTDISQLLPSICYYESNNVALFDYLLNYIDKNNHEIRKEDVDAIVNGKQCSVGIRDRIFRAYYEQTL